MKKYFYKTKFSFLCTPIDIDFCVCVFLVVKLGGEVDVEFGRGIGAAHAAGVICFFIHYLRGRSGTSQHILTSQLRTKMKLTNQRSADI